METQHDTTDTGCQNQVWHYFLPVHSSPTWGAMQTTYGSHLKAGDAMQNTGFYQEKAKRKMAPKCAVIIIVGEETGHKIDLCLQQTEWNSHLPGPSRRAGAHCDPKATAINGGQADSSKWFCFPLNKNYRTKANLKACGGEKGLARFTSYIQSKGCVSDTIQDYFLKILSYYFF